MATLEQKPKPIDPIPIPPSTSYKPNQRHIEDIPGYALCIYCRYCTLTRLGQIEDDGLWRCMKSGKWYKGREIVVYCCPCFIIKDCAECGNLKYCRYHIGVYEPNGWCNNYRDRMYRTPGRYFVGRPLNKLRMIRDPVAKQMELDFTAWKRHALKEKHEKVGPRIQEANGKHEGASDDPPDGSSP